MEGHPKSGSDGWNSEKNRLCHCEKRGGQD